MSKLFDLRFVIGVFFLAIGILLLIHSFVADEQAVQGVNRWCGVAFTLFGALMITLSLRKDADNELLEE